DRGYAIAKTLGVLGASYISWLLASLKIMAFGPDTVGFGIVLIGALSGFLIRDRLRELLRDLGNRWRLLVFIEGLFLACYLAAVTIRRANPDLWERYRGGEKPMDFAYFNAVLKSTSFPPFDPWFAGGYMHYYYFGFVQWASLTRLTGIVPEVAYNLAVPSVFALLCLNVWSAALALIAGIRREPGTVGWRLPTYALLAPLFVAVLGNLDLVHRIGRGEFGYPSHPIGILARLGGVGDIVAGIWNATLHHPAHPPDIYWPSTRIVNGTINEFPAFSFLFADLHAHLMAMPLASAALILACQLLLRRQVDQPTGRLGLRGLRPGDLVERWGRVAVEAVAAGFIASALYATNTWDYPTYLALLAGAFAIRECVWARWQLTYPLVVRIGLWTVGVVVAGRVLFWPFYASFYPQSGIVQQPDRTPVTAYLTIHGLFLLALAGFVVISLRST
ncbi:MAG TPA: DUF2298 domain-containing protein, partial [Thermomicrobiales bacterium]|nr:DUF2298 domain-containing protein [Thermomicrobiales bacterium]